MVKTGDFKTTKGVVQLNAGKGGNEAVKPPKDNDVERFQDFVGEQHMNVGKFELVDEPDYDANPFGFFGMNFGKFGEKLPPRGGSSKNFHSDRSDVDRREYSRAQTSEIQRKFWREAINS